MPSVSKKQHNLMALVANDPKAAKRLGIPKSVGEEFMSADKGKKFKEGGMATNKLKEMFKGKESHAEELKEAKAIKSGKITPEQYAKGEDMEKKMKKGGSCKGYAEGGRIAAKGEHAIQKQSKRGAKLYARGGGIEVRGKTKGKII